MPWPKPPAVETTRKMAENGNLELTVAGDLKQFREKKTEGRAKSHVHHTKDTYTYIYIYEYTNQIIHV